MNALDALHAARRCAFALVGLLAASLFVACVPLAAEPPAAAPTPRRAMTARSTQPRAPTPSAGSPGAARATSPAPNPITPGAPATDPHAIELLARIRARRDLPARLKAIDSGLADPFFGDLDAHERTYQTAVAKLAELERDDADAPPDDKAMITERAAALEGYRVRIEAERACRADKACVAKERAEHLAAAAAVICGAIDDQRAAAADVARVRAQGARAGVIDLAELKDATDTQAVFEARVAREKADFKDAMGVTFAPSMCPRPRP